MCRLFRQRRWIIEFSFMLLAGLILPASTLQAQKPEEQYFTRFIGDQTLGFAHVQAKALLNMPEVRELFQSFFTGTNLNLDKEIAEMLGARLEDVDTVTLYLDKPKVEGSEIGEPQPYFIVRTSKPVDRKQWATAQASKAKPVKMGSYEVYGDNKSAIAIVQNQAVFIYPFSPRTRDANTNFQELLPYFALLEAQQVIPARLKTAVDLAAAGKHHLVMGMNIPEELSRIGEEAFKQAPAGLAPFRGLLKTRSGYMTLHYDPQAEKDFRLFTQLQYDTADAARVGQGGIKFALAMAKLAMTSAPNYDATMKEITELGNKMLNNIQTELVDKEVRITFEASISQYMPMMAAALAKVRRAADQLLSASNMRQLMIAMHNYHNDYNRMPPPVLMKNDQPLHSWRVLVLPYVEEDNLFKQIKLDEPWNSPHNLKIFESTPMPKIFRHPTIREESHKKTYYKVFTSMPGKKPAAGFTLGSNITLGQLTVQDGTSNTLAMIESGPPVLWYQPEDIVFDPEGAFPKLQSPWPDNRVNASFFDASTRSLWLGQHEDIWRALITRNGGEMPDSSKLEEREAK